MPGYINMSSTCLGACKALRTQTLTEKKTATGRSGGEGVVEGRPKHGRTNRPMYHT